MALFHCPYTSNDTSSVDSANRIFCTFENWSSPPQRAVLGVAHYAASSRLERPRVERSVPLERRPELDPEDTWTRMQGPHGLWVIYQNARVMLEMADYAMRNSDSVDRVLLETLRSDAMQIRVCVMMALAQYAFSHASEGVRVNAFRAASMYTGMAARMTQLLQENAAVMVPDFVAAM